jgi:putative flippase GtrA
MIFSNKKEWIRFAKFAIVGISGTLIDIGFFNLFNQRFGISPVTAKSLSFSVAVFNNFIWNRLWTYPESRQLPFSKQFSQYLLVSIIGLLINTTIFAVADQTFIHLFEKILPVNFIFSPTIVGHNTSVAVATIVVLFWNYFANRFWTFRSIK